MATTQPSAATGPIRYVTAASLIDCTGAPPRKDPVIVLRGKRIEQVGTKDTIRIPPDADIGGLRRAARCCPA